MTPPESRQPPGTAGVAVIVFGVCSVLLGCAFIFIYFNHGMRSVSTLRCWLFGGFFLCVGTVTVLRYRWGAVLLAAALIAVALWLGIGSVGSVPFPWILINLFFSVVLFLPAVATYLSWSELR
jgi:hypothetical protein